jgi:hypothetical protein
MSELGIKYKNRGATTPRGTTSASGRSIGLSLKTVAALQGGYCFSFVTTIIDTINDENAIINVMLSKTVIGHHLLSLEVLTAHPAPIKLYH